MFDSVWPIRIMKVLEALVLFLLLAIARTVKKEWNVPQHKYIHNVAGSALQCYNCIAQADDGCFPTPQMCGFDQNACITAMYNFYPYNTFQRCINMDDCLMLQDFSYVSAQCCQTDLCNTFDFI
ncbi:hypothetical protein NFI96_021175 [Prochilodus magdalenae]|nr:hypothetical protein NFI96_021175 [Prochilodus magdalenae]